MTAPATAPVRIGVVGTGSLGYHHARILRDVPGVAFRGFFEANPERAGVVQRELGVRAYATLDALLDDVDAVSVVVPTSRHHEVAMAALAKGKHLLIEKPITVTLAEADELLALAERNGCASWACAISARPGSVCTGSFSKVPRLATAIATK